jgi:hypothetical protein
MKWLIAATVVLVLSTGAFAAPGTWTGELTASACVGNHMTALHGKTESPRECAVDCIKEGAKYVLVSKGKVYMIANQKNPALKTHLGHVVKMSGDLKGTSITVAKIEMTEGGAR